jgi:hypothetical protein
MVEWSGAAAYQEILGRIPSVEESPILASSILFQEFKKIVSFGSAVVETSTTDCDIKGSNPGKETGGG